MKLEKDIETNLTAQFLFLTKQKTDKGISGEILFNEEGKRTHFHLEITELSKEGFKKIGTWDPVHGVIQTYSC